MAVILRKLLVTILFVLVSGCCPEALIQPGQASPELKSEWPFNEEKQLIFVGKTSREEVHRLLGSPFDHESEGKWEIYRRSGDGIDFTLLIPYPVSNSWSHYFLVTYDNSEVVSAIGSGTEPAYYSDARYQHSSKGTPIYAGDIAYYTGTGKTFQSVDYGGDADTAWYFYLKYEKDYLGISGISPLVKSNPCVSHRISKPSDGWYYLCKATKLGHPLAFKELGDIYKEGKYYTHIHQDNVKACFWLSLANNNALSQRCQKDLTPDQQLEVINLVENWYPLQCEHELHPE